ncbi:MAG: 1-deoxy-D-xylulose-5-phosphate synthase [Planctomycetota bacterium]
MNQTPLLDRIQSPEDLRALPEEALPALAAEIRLTLTEVVGLNGGHLASNLGAVELTLALHRAFDFSRHYLVFDVGHQCYTHKLVTGRRARFHTLRTKNGLTGFPNPRESGMDLFLTGHAATSISSALGLAMAARLRGEARHAVAVIGDGSIASGLAFEALNHAGHCREDLLVVLNDNEMSIAQTVGALSGYLSRIRSEPVYARLREDLRIVLQRVPLIGVQLERLHETILDGMKQMIEPGHIFTDLGFRYFGPIDGHDAALLEKELRQMKNLPGPRLLHVLTQKGRGFEAAANDPEAYHSANPFDVLPAGEVVARGKSRRTYTEVFSEALLAACEGNDRIVAITAAMPAGTGLDSVGKRFPARYFDVGICEAHAVALAGALARGGLTPVVVIYSTFLQRGYDQIFHDVCLQESRGVVFALDRAGLVGADGPTHHGVFDIAFLRHLPGMTLLAPRDGGELGRMLEFALGLGQPVAIRYPRASLPAPVRERYDPIQEGRAEVLRKGGDGTLLAYGAMVAPAYMAAEACAREGMEIGVVNLRFAKPLDEECILDLARDSRVLFTAEEGALAGGVGSAVAELLADRGALPRLFTRFGVPDRFIEHASRDELLASLGLDAEGMKRRILEVLKRG